MTQEEKQLLLKDLCERLPYGVKMTDGVDTYRLTSPFLYKYIEMELKPYLRPMSTMTEEEKDEFYKTYDWDYGVQGTPFDWLNAHHFDYRGLIDKGLALEAPEDMYKTE